ncbi:MAG: hypothetical protein ACLSAP_02815 [Oscillospiraceae bacterium]
MQKVSADRSDIDAILHWNYQVDCKSRIFEQDTLHMKVDLTNKISLGENNNLFDAFAKYMHLRETLLKTMKTHLGDPTSQEVANAFKTFVCKANDVMDAWNTSSAIELPYAETPAELGSSIKSYDCAITAKLQPGASAALDKRVYISPESAVPLPADKQPQVSFTESVDPENLSAGDTADIRLTIPNLSLFKQRLAKPTVWLERNNNLFDSDAYTDIAVNKNFLYRTSALSWDPLIPSQEYGGLAVIPEKAGVPMADYNMHQVVDCLKKGLQLDDPDVPQGLTCSLEATYAYDLIEGNPLSAIRLPILLTTSQTLDEVFYNTLANALQAWCETEKPALERASIYFNITIWTAEQKQLLQLRSLRIDIDKK